MSAILTIPDRDIRMISRDAICLDPYICKGRNKNCECNVCVELVVMRKKKIHWQEIIKLNGNIKGGKTFIRSELPKFVDDKVIKLKVELKERTAKLKKIQIKQDEVMAERIIEAEAKRDAKIEATNARINAKAIADDIMRSKLLDAEAFLQSELDSGMSMEEIAERCRMYEMID